MFKKYFILYNKHFMGLLQDKLAKYDLPQKYMAMGV